MLPFLGTLGMHGKLIEAATGQHLCLAVSHLVSVPLFSS